MTLATVLIYSSIPFVLVTLYFGTRNGFYNTDKYDGDGTAHKVLKWFNKSWWLGRFTQLALNLLWLLDQLLCLGSVGGYWLSFLFGCGPGLSRLSIQCGQQSVYCYRFNLNLWRVYAWSMRPCQRRHSLVRGVRLHHPFSDVIKPLTNNYRAQSCHVLRTGVMIALRRFLRRRDTNW